MEVKDRWISDLYTFEDEGIMFLPEVWNRLSSAMASYLRTKESSNLLMLKPVETAVVRTRKCTCVNFHSLSNTFLSSGYLIKSFDLFHFEIIVWNNEYFSRFSQSCEKRLLVSSCLLFRLSAWNKSVPIGRIFMKFYIRVFFENLSRNSSFIKIWQV
jgi:hypothetical protein